MHKYEALLPAPRLRQAGEIPRRERIYAFTTRRTPQQACPVLDTTKDEGSPALAHRSASARRREVRDRCLPAEALRRQGRGVFQPPD